MQDSPLVRPDPPRERLRRTLRRLAKRLERAAERARADADPEAVHDLRVALRRMEAALWVWQDLLAGKPLRRALRGMRNLRRRAGAARESEVHAAALRALAPEAPSGLAPEIEALAAQLDRRRERELARLRSRLGPLRLARLVRRIRRALRPAPEILPSGALRAASRRAESRRRRALGALIEAHTATSDEALHAARLRVKRWRYAEEALAAASGSAMAGADTLRGLQQLLGEVQDHAMLRERALEMAKAAPAIAEAARARALAWLIMRAEADRRAALARFRSQPLPDASAPPA